jgi:hypothetical protein
LPGRLANAYDSVGEVDREGVRGGVAHCDLEEGVWKLLSRGDIIKNTFTTLGIKGGTLVYGYAL